MNPIRTLIVDDEPLAREGIRLLIENKPAFQVIGECGSGAEALEFLNQQPADLLFIDVQMPEMNGIEAAAAIRQEPMPIVVFVTAYDQYALEAFRVHALDYLLKPFNDAQFYSVLDRIRALVEQRQFKDLSDRLIQMLSQYHQARNAFQPISPATDYITRIPVTADGKIVFIRTSDIEWIEAADYYVEIHTRSGMFLHRETMNRLESQLDPKKFFRIHRSTIVPLGSIQALEPYFNGEYYVVLENGRKFKLSKNRADELKRQLQITA